MGVEGRAERDDFYLAGYQSVSMSVFSKLRSAGRTGVGARPGSPDQTLSIQPEATKSLMQEKIRFSVPVTLIESGFLNHIVAVTPG